MIVQKSFLYADLVLNKLLLLLLLLLVLFKVPLNIFQIKNVSSMFLLLLMINAMQPC